MELHLALKEIISQEGDNMINNIQIINFLLDYQAFKERPATKQILRDVINSGYAKKIHSLNILTPDWQTKFKRYQYDFIDLYGYKEELAIYVFESIAYGIGLLHNGTCLHTTYTKETKTFIGNLTEFDDNTQTILLKEPQTASVDQLDIEKLKKMLFYNPEYKLWTLSLADRTEVRKLHFIKYHCFHNALVNLLQKVGILSEELKEIRKEGTWIGYRVLINDKSELERIVEDSDNHLDKDSIIVPNESKVQSRVKSNVTGHTEISFYTGDELNEVLNRFVFNQELKDGAQQRASLVREIGNKQGQLLIDYFKKMGIIKWNSYSRSYFASREEALELIVLHDGAYHKKEPYAIANHLLKYKQIPIYNLTTSSIQFNYKCSNSVANEVFKYLPVPNPDISLKFPNEMIKQVIIKLLHNRPIDDCLKSVPIKDVAEVIHLFEESGILDNNGKLRKEGFYINPSVQSILNRIQMTEIFLYNN